MQVTVVFILQSRRARWCSHRSPGAGGQATHVAMMAGSGAADSGAGWGGHPRGLSTLFFTEMWERFSYYGMRGFLILYATAAAATGGLGFDVRHGASIYKWYTSSVWLTPILGGFIAGLFLGQYRSVFVGGVGMTLGLIQYVVGRQRLSPALARLAAPRRPPVDTGQVQHVWKSLRGFTTEERNRIAAVFVFFLFAALFWGAYEQAGSTLNLFADRYTDLNVLGYLIPSSWLQSVQPIMGIPLAPALAVLWVRLGPPQPARSAKFAIGLLCAGVAFLLLVPAGLMAQSGAGVKVSPLWLVAAYIIEEIGELCLSPVGLSAVTKLAPARIVSLMMGVFFLSNWLGNLLAGWTAGFFSSMPLSRLFAAVAAVCLVAAAIMALLVKPVRNLMGDVH